MNCVCFDGLATHTRSLERATVARLVLMNAGRNMGSDVGTDSHKSGRSFVCLCFCLFLWSVRVWWAVRCRRWRASTA